MTHLQQLTAIRLGIDFGTVAEAMSTSHPAVIIAADGTGLPGGLDLPLTVTDGRQLTIAGEATRTLTLSPATQYGAVQVARNGDRSIVVASSAGNAADLDQLLGWLADSPDRWATAAGDAVVKAADQQPVFVESKQATAAAEDSAHGVWPYAAAAAIAVALACGVLLLLRRRRR